MNGTLVGHRPYGYSNFAVSIGEHLRYGEENTIAVDATAHEDSRWYSGAGIYRNVHLVVGEPVHLALDGVHVTTPDGRRRRRRDRGRDGRRERVHASRRRRRSRRRSSTTPVPSSRVDVAPLTVFPGRAETLRQRLLVARPRRWSVDAAGRSTRAAPSWTADGERARPRRRRRSASAPSPSTPSVACASTANRSTCAARASTTTTASSAAPRSLAPTNAGSRSSRKPASTRCAARTTR